MCLVEKRGSGGVWRLPERLYHGTSDIHLLDIFENGLGGVGMERRSALSTGSLYLSSSMEFAKSYAMGSAHNRSGIPIILEVSSLDLVGDLISFDWNLCLRNCSVSIRYEGVVDRFLVHGVEGVGEYQILFEEPDNFYEPPLCWYFGT